MIGEKMKDGRGSYTLKVKADNRERIIRYISSNPECLKSEICRDLNITYTTLRNHLREINESE